MHELSVCLALVGQLEKIASERRARSVTRIALEIGPLSGVEPGLLKNAWPLAAAGSVAHGAELDISAAAIVVRCTECGQESDARANRLVCGHCGDWRTEIVHGDQMMLMRVELENATAVGDTPDTSRPGSSQTLQ